MAGIKYWAVFIGLAFAGTCAAQDINGEIAAQIAALKGYIYVAEKGYQIAEDGIHAIRDIKYAEYVLHRGFFEGLKVVRPVVKRFLERDDVPEQAGSAPVARDGLLNAMDGERFEMLLRLSDYLRDIRIGKRQYADLINVLIAERQKELLNIK